MAEFVQAVASAEQPVPAGGSVAALTGAGSAALVALACEVSERHNPGVLTQSMRDAQHLQQRLLALVDADAVAFRTFLESERGSSARRAAGARAAVVPMDIGRACRHITDVIRIVKPHVSGPMQLDIDAANNMAIAAARSTLDIAKYNLSFVADPALKHALESELAQMNAFQT